MNAFILYSKSQVNSFVRSGVIADIDRNSSVQVFVKNWELLPEEFSSLPKQILLNLHPLIRRVSGLVQMCSLWRHKDRSMNHTVRAYASFGSRKQRRDWTCVVVSEMKVNLFKRLVIRILSKSPFFEFLKWFELGIRNILISRKILCQFKDCSSLLIPFSGHIGIEFGTYVWIAKRIGIKSIAIQENWDNLSTKTFLTEEPDFFFVWGKQSEGHIRAIHKMRNTQVKVIGSPRFSKYYSSDPSKPVVALPNGKKIAVSKPFVLIGGTGDGIDDEVLLSTTFSALSDYINEIDIVYRPHPMSRTAHNLTQLEKKYSSLLIDAGKEASDFGHQIPLIQNCFILLNHFSTLTLEGLIAGTQVAVPLFLGRESAKYRYRDILNEWHHMSGISFLSNLHLPSNPDEFAICLRNSFQKRTESKISQNIDWVCHKSQYSTEFLSALEHLQI